MISPAEITRKTFEQARHGYDVNEVDKFIRALSTDYTKLYNENADLIKKLGILVEKIEEYKQDEEYIKSAVISMQKANDVAVAEANKKADEIIRETGVRAEEILASANSQAEKITSGAENLYEIEKAKIDGGLQDQRNILEAMKTEVAEFKANIFALYKVHLDTINAIPSTVGEQQGKDFNEMVNQSQDNTSASESSPQPEPAAEKTEEKLPAEASVPADTAEIQIEVSDSKSDMAV